VERGAEKETAGDGRKFTKAAWSLSVIASLRVRVRRLHFQSAMLLFAARSSSARRIIRIIPKQGDRRREI